ncbi:MAG: hypothetical protein NVSMB24_37390 [Mucilaginibacter sp.]
MKKQKTMFIATILMMFAIAFVIQSCSKTTAVAPPGNPAGLKTEIDLAATLYANTVAGHQAGEYDSTQRVLLNSTIIVAKSVLAGTFTQQQYNNAVSNLQRVVATYQSSIVEDVSPVNLVAEWKFNGNAKDATGNGHDGILTTGYIGSSAATAVDGGTLPTLTPDRFGRANMAYHFNNGATVDVPWSSAFNPQSFTISLWLSRDGTNSNNYMVSFDRWNGYKFQLQGGNLPFLTVQTTAGYHDQDDGGASVTNPNVWTHVAVSYTAGTEKFYINGVLVKTATFPAGTLIPAPSNVDFTIGNELLKKDYVLTDNGSDPNHYWGGDYFIGSLSNIRFYNVALTDSQIHSIWSIESAP